MKEGAGTGPILLVGAAGQLGRALMSRLGARQAVVPVTRRELDLERAQDIRTLVRATAPSLIVNAAAYTAVDAAEIDAERCTRINAIAPGVLAEEADRLGVPIVHYSTNYVFDGRHAEPYSEDDPISPLGVYGATKAAGESAVATAARRHLILRTAAVYAAGTRNFMTRMLELAREMEDLRVVDDQFISPTPTWLLADATCSAIAPMRDAGELTGTFHVTTRGQTSWFGFAVRIFQLSEVWATGRVPAVTPVRSSAYVTAARRPQNGVLAVGRFEAATGCELPSWDVALEQTLCVHPHHT